MVKIVELELILNAPFEPINTDIINKYDGQTVGSWDRDVYAPVTKGGEIDRSQVIGKFEAYNGNRTIDDFVLGVDIVNGFIISAEGGGSGNVTRLGNYNGSYSGWVNNILVSEKDNQGYVHKVISATHSSRCTLTNIGSGTLKEREFSLQYPYVFRVLEDIGGLDNNDEYYYYNNGGVWPWPGVVLHEWTVNFDGNACIQLDTPWEAIDNNYDVAVSAIHTDDALSLGLLAATTYASGSTTRYIGKTVDTVELLYGNGPETVIAGSDSSYYQDLKMEVRPTTFRITSDNVELVNEALGGYTDNIYPYIGSYQNITDWWIGQIPELSFIDYANSNNTITPILTVTSRNMPTTNIVYDNQGANFGTIVSPHSTQPWVPRLHGGGVNGSHTANKYEAYSGDYGDATTFILGLDTVNRFLTAHEIGGKVGSWFNKAVTGDIGNILVAKNSAAVIEVESIANSSAVVYTALQGTTGEIRAGFEYPHIYRVLEDDGGVDDNSEYWWYAQGNPQPWNGGTSVPSFTWVPPLSRADGSAMLTVQSYTIEYGPIGDILTSVQTTALEFTIPNAVPGTVYRGRISVTDVNNKTSQLSGFVYFKEPT